MERVTFEQVLERVSKHLSRKPRGEEHAGRADAKVDSKEEFAQLVPGTAQRPGALEQSE